MPLTNKVTPKRLEVLHEIHRFGTVAVMVQYGWQTRMQLFAVHGLTELKDVTSIALDMKKLGWLNRSWVEGRYGRMPVLSVSRLGLEIMGGFRP